ESGAELSGVVIGERAQTDLTVQQLNEQNDWNLRSVPYTDGAGEGILAVMPGAVDAQVSTTSDVQGHITSADVKILSVLADEPEPENPDAATIDEFDLEVPMGTSFYLVSPDGLDDQLRSEMISTIDQLTESDEWAATLEDLGLPQSALDHEATQEELSALIEEYDVLEP